MVSLFALVLSRKSVSKLQQYSERMFDLFAVWDDCLFETAMLCEKQLL